MILWIYSFFFAQMLRNVSMTKNSFFNNNDENSIAQQTIKFWESKQSGYLLLNLNWFAFFFLFSWESLQIPCDSRFLFANCKLQKV